MPRGFPDYQTLDTKTVKLEQGSVNQSVFDTGFSRLDGGGRVVYFDDFRGGLYRYSLTYETTGVYPALAFEEGVRFGFSPSVNLNPLANGQIVEITHGFTLPLSNRMGIEFAVRLLSNHGRFYMYFYTHASNTQNFYAHLILDPTTNTFQIYDGAYHTVFTPFNTNGYNNGIWKIVKLVFDPVSGMYESIYVGTDKIDLSAYHLVSIGQDNSGEAYFYFGNEATSATKKQPVYLGYICITADEP